MVPGCSASQMPWSTAGILAGREPVGQLGEAEPGLAACCLAHSWPLTQTFTGQGQYVQTLMNAWPTPRPTGRSNTPDPAVLLVEGELRALARVGVALAGDEHPLRLLGHPDRRDLRPPGGGRGVQVGPSPRCCGRRPSAAPPGCDWPRERGHPAAEGVPDLLQARRGRHRLPAVIQELDDLPADLQLAQVTVQVQTVQALQVQATCPSSTSFTVTGTDRLIRDAMATSGTCLRTEDAPTCTDRLRNRKSRRSQAEPPGSLLN